MDNNSNQTIEQPQTQAQPVEPVQPAAFPNPQPTTNITQPDMPKKSSPMIWMVVGLIILIIILTAGYFYLGQTSTNTSKIPPLPQATPKIQTSIDSLNSDLANVDVASAGAEFNEVDKDLQSI